MSDRGEALQVVAPAGRTVFALPAWMSPWLAAVVDRVTVIQGTDGVSPRVLRERPRLIVFDARADAPWPDQVLTACAELKRDRYAGVVPVLVVAPDGLVASALDSGADEAIDGAVPVEEGLARCAALLRRSERDLDVHPSTRLPGALAIQAELERRVHDPAKFAVGYADLDHFKEFNDRYGYHRGDAVIRLVARILHDVVKGRCGTSGFVGHIGGDDFLFALPLEAMPSACDDIVATFRELSPLQYSEQDRRMGYYFGKDRRGQLHRVPLMSLSIGVVTNQRRHFTRGEEVSAMASEMKAYAKTLPGSVWAVDRRREEQGTTGTPRRRMRDQLDLQLPGGAP